MQLLPNQLSDFTILGVDPGLRCTGYGIIRVRGSRLTPIAWGAIKPKSHEDEALAAITSIATTPLAYRLGQIYTGLTAVIKEYKPDCSTIEVVFVNVNPQSTLLLGQARGAAITALVQAGLAVYELTALQVKQGVSGYGRATKEQIRFMVKTLLAIPEDTQLTFDAADALACAISTSFQLKLPQSKVATNTLPISPNKGEVGSVLADFQNQTQRRRKSNRWTNVPTKAIKPIR